MICKNCGEEMPKNAVFCSKCGVKMTPMTPEKEYCIYCGAETFENEKICRRCGANKESEKEYCKNCGAEINKSAVVCNVCGRSTINLTSKSKTTAGILGILLGVWGVHNFYLGYTEKAIVQLLLGTVGLFLFGIGGLISFIWGLVEGILILCGSINRDGKGNWIC